MEKTYYLPAEWHRQSYIQLTWPHAETDWAYMLDEVEECFFNLAREIATRQPLLLVAPEFPDKLKDAPFRTNIHFVACPTNLIHHARQRCRGRGLCGRLLHLHFHGYIRWYHCCIGAYCYRYQ